MLSLGKITKMPQAVKASVALFLASIITKGLAFITTPLYTRLLSTTEYGKISVYYTWMQLFGIIAMFCLGYGVFNCGMVDYSEKRDEFSFSVLILSNIITLSFMGLLLCFYPIVKAYLSIELPYILLMCATFLFQPAYSFWATRQRYELKYKLTSLFSIISAIISPGIALLCLLLNQDGDRLAARILGAELPLLVMNIGFYILLGVKARFKIEKKYWKFVLTFNIPLIPHYLSAYLLNSSDKLMIEHYVGDEATAFYSVAYSVASMALIVWSAIDSSLLPFTFESLKAHKYKRINQITIPLIAIFGAGCFCVILLAPEVIGIMAPHSYSESIYAIPAIVGATFFQAQYLLYSNIIYYYKKPKYVLLGSITSAAVNIILNMLLIPRFGYLVAGYTTLTGFACQALIDYFGMKKACQEPIYNMKVILALSLLIIVISSVCMIIYQYAIVRFSVLALTAIIMFILKDKIMAIFKTMKSKGNENE